MIHFLKIEQNHRSKLQKMEWLTIVVGVVAKGMYKANGQKGPLNHLP